MSRLLALALVAASACASSETRAIAVQVVDVPAGATALEAAVTVGDVESGGRFVLGAAPPRFAVAVPARATGPFAVSVTAFADDCLVAESTGGCDDVARACDAVTVVLAAVAPRCGATDGAPPADMTLPPGSPGVTCGAASCGAEPCCVSPTSGARACAADCSGRLAYACDEPADCGGDRCCATADGAACSASCPAADQLCKTALDCGPALPNCCPDARGFGRCAPLPC